MLRFLGLLVLLALVGAGVYIWQVNPRRPPQNLGDVKERLKDGVLTGGVKTAFSLHRRLKQYPISVATENAVVTLTGQLPKEDLRAAAERLAAGVPEVSRVEDKITIGGEVKTPKDDKDERSVGERLDDEALEVQARMAFSLNKNLKAPKLQVTAWKKELKLSGEAPNAELRTLALETLREIAGATTVTDTTTVAGESAAPDAAGEQRRAAVLRALHANPNLPREIEVRVDGERTVLSGRVRSGAERDLAGLLARDALGRAVQNELAIRP